MVAPPLPGADELRDTCEHGYTSRVCLGDGRHRMFAVLEHEFAMEGVDLLAELARFPYRSFHHESIREGDSYV